MRVQSARYQAQSLFHDSAKALDWDTLAHRGEIGEGLAYAPAGMYVFQRLLGEPEPAAGMNRVQAELGRQVRHQRTFPAITVAVTLRRQQPGGWCELAYGR